LTLTFQANPVNLHDDPHAPAPKTDYSATAVFTLPVAAPAAVLAPDYMPYLPMGDMFNAEFMRTSHERARAFYARYEQPDLAKALAHYQEILRLHQEQARRTGQPVLDSQTWVDMGHVLRQMGRKQEARAAFEEGVRDALYPDDQRRMAKEALEAVDRDLAWSVGRPAPAFTVTDLNGRPQSPQRYRGQVLVIHLWATGDEKERTDLPTLKALHDRYSGRGVAVLGVGVDVDEPAFRKFVKEHDLPWPQVYERSGSPDLLGLVDLYGSPAAPRTILIDRRGAIRALDLHGPALQSAVEKLLAAD
jgi:peroxiredoxin